MNCLLAGRLVRFRWAWSFAIVLLFGLLVAQSVSAFATVDQGFQISVAASDGAAGSMHVPLPCDKVLACAAFMLPPGAVTAFISNSATVLRPDFAQTQPRFGSPSVSLPPPRPLI